MLSWHQSEMPPLLKCMKKVKYECKSAHGSLLVSYQPLLLNTYLTHVEKFPGVAL